MASGVYGRRVVDSHIGDNTLFSQDQYPVSGASRVLSNELESVWDKVNDAKSVLQKLEHRIEATDDAKKAEDLALSVNEANSLKKSATKKSLRPVHNTSGNMTIGSSSIANRTSVGHKVGFQEPVVSYREEYDPLHGSSAAANANLGSSGPTIQSSGKSFVARDFRSNNADASRVTVRSKPVNQNVPVTEPRQIQTQNGFHDDEVLMEDANSPLKGNIVPTRVLNDAKAGLPKKKIDSSLRPKRDVKSAGVANTVTHCDPQQVYKYLRKEGSKNVQASSSQSVYPSMGPRSPLFLASPYAPYKRIDIVKQRKKMKQNSEALERLKEKIQKQKERSPSIDASPNLKVSRREEDPIISLENNFNLNENERPRMRKIAHGPAAPQYKGFSTAETRIRTPDGKVWKQGEVSQPYNPRHEFQPEKKPKAVSSLFKGNETKSKPPITSGRLKPENFGKINKSKNQKPVRKTGKITTDNSIHKKSIITPSSWREGQRVAESILGPPPKQPKKAVARGENQRPDSPPTRDSVLTGQQKRPQQSRPGLKPSGGKQHQKKLASSIKATIPTDKLSHEARGVLDELHLSSSDSDSEQEEMEIHHPHSVHEKGQQRKERSRERPSKHHLPKDAKDTKGEKIPKVRHYVQSEVQLYIAKQKAERKRKQSQERKAHKEAHDRKQKQLEELYKKQKEAASMKKRQDMENKTRPFKPVDIAAVQAMRRMDLIIDGDDPKIVEANESDKENIHTKKQPLAKFDERMSAFMEKLNRIESSAPPPATYAPQRKESEKRPVTSASAMPTETSEFMQKLDRYLKDDTPVTGVSVIPPGPSPGMLPSDSYAPNLTVEDLGSVNETSPLRDRYGDPTGSFSPRYRQMMEQTPPNEAKAKSRADRIAALRAQAESLQERIQTESRKLVEQPIVPIQPRLEEIDAILAKSGHGQSLPIYAWSPEKRDPTSDPLRHGATDRGGYGGVDVPDTRYTRGGLSELSPTQLPGVAGLRQHVTETEKLKSENDAALKIQASYRGHSVRQAMDDWKLPSGSSLTDLRRQATSAYKVSESQEKLDEDDYSISEGPLSSRSDSHPPDTPIKLRSVEEILADMKKKEYCVADPPPIDDLMSKKWDDVRSDEALNNDAGTDFLAGLGVRETPSVHPSYPMPQLDSDKPPWQRSGGDKNSIINIIADKYLKTQKGKQKHAEKSKTPRDDNEIRIPHGERALSPPSHKHQSQSSLKLLQSEKVITSKKSPKTSEKYSPRFEDDTAHDASETLSSVSDVVSKPQSYTSPRERSYQKSPTMKDVTIPKVVEQSSEILAGKVSYSSDDDFEGTGKSSTGDRQKRISGAESLPSVKYDKLEDLPLEASLEISDSSLAPLPKRLPQRPHPSVPIEKKFSPAALEQKMTAELNYQEAVEESLRHLTGVERTQGVSLAQQETVSLAQLMKARQLQHEMELDRITLKAKEDAFEAEKIKAGQRSELEDKRAKENLKMQEASRKALEMQAEAARSTAAAAKHLANALRREPGRSYPESYSQSSDRSKSGSYTTSESARLKVPESESSSESEKKGKASPDRRKPRDSPPSLMSEHSTTSVRMSDNDTQSSIPEQMASTEEEDDRIRVKKLQLDKLNSSDTADSISEEIQKKSTARDDSDKSISEELSQRSDGPIPQKQERSVPLKKKQKEPKDDASDSSENSSVHFDETLTEDEIAEISRRAVVASEVHRRHQRRRSPHTGHRDRSDISSDDQPSITRQKTPRGGIFRSLDDFTIGSGVTGAAESEFVHFMDDMVRQYMLEEEVRAKHQAAMLKLRQRAIKEKTEGELAMLSKMKQQVKSKGEDEQMPPIKKKQRAILRRFKIENDEIKKLKAVTKAASQERKLFLQQHKGNAARRAKLRATDVGDVDPRDELKDVHVTSSTPIPNSDRPDLIISESNSELDISSTSSMMLKTLKNRSFDEHRLTKREQRLMHRKKQAEQLIAWKRRLDQEEKKICDIEKQALSAWDKDGILKPDKSKRPIAGEKSSQKSKDAREEEQKLSPKTDSSREESSSGKSPESEHHSSPPPPSHSESSIAEEIIQINSGTNSSRSVLSPEDKDAPQRNQEESSDGTNADEYSQSFESVTGSQRTPRSPRRQKDTDKETEENAPIKIAMPSKKNQKEIEKKPGDVDSPSATPLLPSKKDDPTTFPTTSKHGPQGSDSASRRKESIESWSDESFSQTQSETEQSDIECRVRALKEELKRRRLIAERLKKEQKRRHKDRLKAQEASLRSQIEAYDVFIRKTQTELTQELGNSAGVVGPVAKPQIRSPRKTDQGRQSARAIRGATASVASPEASPRSGSHRTPAILTKQRTESESSGKSSRSLSFDDEEKDDVTPNGSTKSFSAVVAPLPSKPHDSLSSGASTPTEKRVEKPKRLDLTDAATTLSKLTKPLSPNGFTPPSPGEKPKSMIPVASKTSPPPSVKTPPSSMAQTPPKTTSVQPSRKSLIPLPVSTSSQDISAPLLASKLKEKSVTSPPSPQPSEKSLAYSEDFEASVASSKKTQEDGSVTGSVTTDEDISEHFSDVSGTSGERSDKSGVMLDLSSLPEKLKASSELNKDDSLHGVEDLGENKDLQDDDDEKTPVISPAHTPIPSSPRTPTPDYRETAPAPFAVGDKVLLAGRETGIVRFVGETSFAPGMWVGAELQKDNGKNDGSVNGVRYFTCEAKHGIFAPLNRVSLLSPKSQSALHFEYGEKSPKHEEDDIKHTESELSKAISNASEKLDELAKDVPVPMESEVSPKKSPPPKTDVDRNRLADELSDRLLTSLLEDSMSHVLESHGDKRQRQNECDDQDAKRRKKETESEEKSSGSSDEDDIPLTASTRKLLEMLSSSPDKEDQDKQVDIEAETELKAHSHESLADTFTGNLLQDTLTKVLEIRKQRERKWRQMEQENGENKDTVDGGEDFKLDDGREVENIFEARGRSEEEEAAEDKESTTPVRPVSPILGASHEDGLEDWFEDDIGISSFHKNKPTIHKEDLEHLRDEDDVWQDGRLIEVLSSRIEPPPPPPKFVVPHKPEHILRLVEDAVDYYYSKYLRGELDSDVRIPDFLYDDKSDELSEKEDSKDSDEVDQEKKDADLNANHIFKTSLFDMVREVITEIYSTKSHAEEASKRPIWLKKKSINRPSYCRRTPRNGEELLQVVSQQINRVLDLSGDAHKLDPKVTMKWGNRKKKDKVDLILIQELREEEPEWTNYDEDETTVKMQLTDTVLDMLLSDTIKCLDKIERKREERESITVPTAEQFDEADERSQ